MSLSFCTVRGGEFQPYMDTLGALRISVFREWPYLYEGDLNYERKYLSTYATSSSSFGFFVFDGKELVGATTAIELLDETSEFQKPFLEQSIPVQSVIYFGESILLSKYRGLGLGKKFMQERLNYALSFTDKKYAAFCAVQREIDHPLKPKGYVPLDGFWKLQGFLPRAGMTAQFSWKDLGEQQETQKTLQFWLRSLEEEA
ncbi:MAG: GNAT family N-acetyltransferase [Bdellovibrionaceae bacterium]|nr:GNAT family N-acetyltransferase [Pseudobdellovibrionaceae bacterium]